MAIQGGFYFTTQYGTVTIATALNNPFNTAVTVSNEPFLQNQFLEDVITDTHYDNPDRRGRHVAFLSRIMNDYQIVGKGIACEEYTAICIDTLGLCKIFGEYPAYDEDIYFIQPNCELVDMAPEVCLSSLLLTWNHGGTALKVYHANGTLTGVQTFDLSDWKTGGGGVWEHWSVDGGVLNINSGTSPQCNTGGLSEMTYSNTLIYPNPNNSGQINLISKESSIEVVTDLKGQVIPFIKFGNSYEILSEEKGIYFVTLNTALGKQTVRFVIQ